MQVDSARGSHWRLPGILFLAASILFVVVGGLRGHRHRVWGDESTYLMMASSLAHDLDLRFDSGDLERAWVERGAAPEGLILQRHGGQVFYSKPILYPLVAAPFYHPFGSAGLVLLNFLALGAGMILASACLARYAVGDRALVVTTFVAASSLLPYVVWRMTESFEVGLVLAGLSLTMATDREARPGSHGLLQRFLSHPAAPYLGAFLLGLAASVRYPNVLLALVPAMVAVTAGRVLQGVRLAITSVVALGIVTGLTFVATGAPNPYKAERATFGAATGYPVGVGEEVALARFEALPARNSLGLRPKATPAVSGYAALYFLLGRHTGLLFYLPFAIALVGAAVRSFDRAGFILLCSVVLLALFYLLWMPGNYFGGGTAIGNRYFLPAYAALLFVPRVLPRRREIAAVWVLASIIGVSGLVSVARSSAYDDSSQNHTGAGIFRLLPYESTAPDLDGRQDRYWAGDFVRFVDANSEVGRRSFELRSDRPAAELLVARVDSESPIHLMVASEESQLILRYADWRRDEKLVLGTGEKPVRATVTFDTSPAWRRHRFWFGESAGYQALSIRLALRSVNDQVVRATVHYVGDGTLLDWRHDREVLACALPGRVVAGSRSSIMVRLRNVGTRAWSSDGVLPIHLAYRLSGEAGTIEGGRLRLEATVAPGGELRTELPIDWPETPGSWEVVVDLVMEEVAWFAERTGAPVARGVVEVAPAP